MAGAFGGILAWGIGHMRGVAGLSGWRYVTISLMLEIWRLTRMQMDLYHRGNTHGRSWSGRLLVRDGLASQSHVRHPGRERAR